MFMVVVVHIDGLTLRLWTAAYNGPVVHAPDDVLEWRATVEWYWQGETKNSENNHWSANSTWTEPGVNPVLRGESPATNRLSHEKVLRSWLWNESDMRDGTLVSCVPPLVWHDLL
jgi:hypothetical protein